MSSYHTVLTWLASIQLHSQTLMVSPCLNPQAEKPRVKERVERLVTSSGFVVVFTDRAVFSHAMKMLKYKESRSYISIKQYLQNRTSNHVTICHLVLSKIADCRVLICNFLFLKPEGTVNLFQIVTMLSKRISSNFCPSYCFNNVRRQKKKQQLCTLDCSCKDCHFQAEYVTTPSCPSWSHLSFFSGFPEIKVSNWESCPLMGG